MRYTTTLSVVFAILGEFHKCLAIETIQEYSCCSINMCVMLERIVVRCSTHRISCLYQAGRVEKQGL